MATLTIRNLDSQVEELLRVRAARNGRSIEAEAHAILTEMVGPSPREMRNLAEAIGHRFAPLDGVELELHPPVAIEQQRDRAYEIMKRRYNALRELAR
ncbi:plasmid stabilization protein [Methylobacterium sp. EM32]|uniref:FitA-like ribbon-helix-helix domain-containing protein n=1 Tax=Methylobacterium sp. EM32 TaxID=3163481 RepID=UPI0033B6CF24